MTQISVALLRGVHTTPHAPAVVRMVKDADIILLEGPALISEAQRSESIYNAISNDPAYIKTISKIINDPSVRNFNLEIVWSFRGSGKIFGVVDLLVDESEADKLNAISFAHPFRVAIHAMARNPEQRYKLMDQFVAVNVRSIHDRNTVVVEQIGHVVHRFKKLKRSIKIAVVQGYSHRIEAELRQHLNDPTIQIHSAVFAPGAVEHLLQNNPIASLIAKKLDHPNIPLSHKEIDYALYWVLSISNQTKDDLFLDNKKDKEISIEMQAVGESHAVFQHILKKRGEIGSIDKYTEQQLADEVDNLLSYSQ